MKLISIKGRHMLNKHTKTARIISIVVSIWSCSITMNLSIALCGFSLFGYVGCFFKESGSQEQIYVVYGVMISLMLLTLNYLAYLGFLKSELIFETTFWVVMALQVLAPLILYIIFIG
jgi:hypothetical protein